MDDFRPSNMPFNKLLRVLDRYPVMVETKGSSRYLNSKNIIITAPMSPKEMFNYKTDEDIQQLLRRIDVIKDFDAIELPKSTSWGNTNPAYETDLLT